MRIRFLALWFALSAFPQSQAESLIDPVVAALRGQRYLEAKQLSEAALKQSPRDVRLWVLNGMSLERLHDTRGALQSYDHALQVAPTYVPALEAAAQLEYARGGQDAAPYLSRLLQLNPADVTAHAMSAALAFKRGDCPSVLTEYARSHPLIDTQTEALEQLGSCQVKLGKAADAVWPLKRLTQLQPVNEDFRYNLAVVESLAGKPRDVIATLTQGGPEQHLDPESLDVLAEAYEAVGDTPHAVAALRAAIIANPNDARYYVDFANLSLVHASYQVGIDMLNVGLHHLPQASSLYVARGVLYVKLGEYDRSDADFKTAEELDPRVDAAASARGMAAFEQNHLPEAEAMIRQRLTRNSQDAFLLYLLAEVLLRRGASAGTPNFEEAIQSARRAIQLQPRFELARDVLARLYLQAGNLSEAIEQSRLAVAEDPADQTALYHLILALRKAQRTAELPPLLKRLTDLREEAMRKENSERHFTLQEDASNHPTTPFGSTAEH